MGVELEWRGRAAGRDLQRRPFRPVVVVPTYDNPLTIERVG